MRPLLISICVIFAILCACPIAEAAPCRGGSCARASVRAPGKVMNVVKAKPARRLLRRVLGR